MARSRLRGYGEPVDELELADWRERVARLYLSDVDLAGFRARTRRPVREPSAVARAVPRLAACATFHPNHRRWSRFGSSRPAEQSTWTPAGRTASCATGASAIATTPYGPLTLWWIEAYGGGLFLPFRDATCGTESYGGGRYLTDTVKGTHGRGVVLLGTGLVRLDFNYAYNPSCAYE